MSLRVGIVGAGLMGHAHCQSYLRAGARVRVVHDTDHVASQRLADTCGAEVASGIDKLLDADIEAVSICVPHSQHYRIGMLAAAHRLHMLIEKPIAVEYREAAALVDACRSMQLRIMVGFINRFYYLQRRLKRQIDAGRFGEIRLVVEHLAADGPSSGYPNWYNQLEHAGGGILLMGASHTVDRIAWLLNSRVQSVFAAAHENRSFGDVEENASATVRYDNGAILSLAACRSSVPTHKRGHHCLIYGTLAEAEMAFEPNGQNRLRIRDMSGTECVESNNDDPFFEMVSEFVDAIEHDRDPSPGGADGLASLAAIRAMYESIATGAAVTPAYAQLI